MAVRNFIARCVVGKYINTFVEKTIATPFLRILLFKLSVRNLARSDVPFFIGLPSCSANYEASCQSESVGSVASRIAIARHHRLAFNMLQSVS